MGIDDGDGASPTRMDLLELSGMMNWVGRTLEGLVLKGEAGRQITPEELAQALVEQSNLKSVSYACAFRFAQDLGELYGCIGTVPVRKYETFPSDPE